MSGPFPVGVSADAIFHSGNRNRTLAITALATTVWLRDRRGQYLLHLVGMIAMIGPTEGFGQDERADQHDRE